jgi:hypothetical protein
VSTGHPRSLLTYDESARLTMGSMAAYPSGIRAADGISGATDPWLYPYAVMGSIRMVRWSRAEAIIASVTCTTRRPSRPLAAGSRSSRIA